MGRAKELYETITADYFPAESEEHRRDVIRLLGRMARRGDREASEALQSLTDHPYLDYELRRIASEELTSQEVPEVEKAKEIYEMITADYFPAESEEHRKDAIRLLGRMARKGDREASEALQNLVDHPYLDYELRRVASEELTVEEG